MAVEDLLGDRPQILHTALVRADVPLVPRRPEEAKSQYQHRDDHYRGTRG